MASEASNQSWYSFLNLDLVAKVLRNSIFHPYVASLIPVCLCASDIPYSDPAFRNTVTYAICICVLWLLQIMNNRLAHGKPRRYHEDDEVVVITGGANGLGHCLAEIYALKGTSVAVLDVQKAKDEIEGVEYESCDVSDRVAVQRTWAKIVKELGTPTVLINNAGIMKSKPLLEHSQEEIYRTFSINTMSHYHLSTIFLQGLIKEDKPGTLVTVSSVLGRLGACRLSAYTASKAALIAYHHSITNELRQYSDIKTILVTPGQLSTEMFGAIRLNPVQRFFGPIVEVQDLAMKMVQMIREGKAGILAEPLYARWIVVLDLLPDCLVLLARKMAGLDTAMDGTVSSQS